MTTLLLYQYFVRFTAFLLALGTLWFAFFFILTWLLHYQLVRFTLIPRSRSEAIAYVMFMALLGFLGIGYALNREFSASLTALEVIVGCVEVIIALIYVGAIRTSVFELRQAVRMRR
jgi:hypothetical protein